MGKGPQQPPLAKAIGGEEFLIGRLELGQRSLPPFEGGLPGDTPGSLLRLPGRQTLRKILPEIGTPLGQIVPQVAQVLFQVGAPLGEGEGGVRQVLPQLVGGGLDPEIGRASCRERVFLRV